MTETPPQRPPLTEELSWQLFDFLQKQGERLEQMLATMSLAFMEMYSITTMLMTTTLTAMGEEERVQWLKKFGEVRSNAYRAAAEATRDGVAGIDPELAGALADLVSKFKSDTGTE